MKGKKLFIIGLAFSILISLNSYLYLDYNSNKDIEFIKDTYAVRMEQYVNSIFHTTDVLCAIVKSNNGEITKEQFDEVAKYIYDNNRGMMAVQLLPKGVVEYCYPIKGNEAVIGNNVFDNKKRVADANLAVNTKSIALSGPYELTQGGIGCVARNPIFMKDEKNKEYFWGFSVVILDLEKMIEYAGLSQIHNNEYDFQLYNDTELDEHFIIAGNNKMSFKNSKTINIEIPHHMWQLIVRPKMPYKNVIISILILIICFTINLLMFKNINNVAKMKESVRLKDRFLSNMSHDIRTPLNTIIGFANMNCNNDNIEDIKENNNCIIESGEYLLGIINNILDSSKIEENKMDLHLEPYKYKDFIQSVNTIAIERAKQKSISFICDNLSIDEEVLIMDKIRMQQIFINIISNAIKYTPNGGMVKWYIKKQFKINDKQISIQFIIEDNGIGMSEDFIKNKIFKNYEQEYSMMSNNEAGTGLGLSIAKNLVEIMGGEIYVDSQLDKGTKFIISIPFEIANIEETNAPQINVEYNFNDKRILLCEDQPLNQKIAVKLLGKQNIKVDIANNGKEGLEKFEKSNICFYDAILMDIRMPVMNGLEATKAIRKLNRSDADSIPIIAMTANAFNEDKNKSLEAGMNAHISKPIDVNIFFNTLYNEINQK